ncbi:uncharacterized protein N7515_007144 [Penicillium bovifimosum]|uniref:Uncharacterized protein n=1 Tax=Penicillium bovifimosum TaxID=126998 RepID=A0A9W9L1T9_9EURO|nr:uncharacterized protein N7515_007144 [Penicillium bovifimosum]KAJ5131105.1 hypothetical protein N7515_007144 [Penicillium bovifimosum]
MIEALCEHLSEKPDEFRTLVTTSSIRRVVLAKGWSKKCTRQQVRERNADDTTPGYSWAILSYTLEAGSGDAHQNCCYSGLL